MQYLPTPLQTPVHDIRGGISAPAGNSHFDTAAPSRPALMRPAARARGVGANLLIVALMAFGLAFISACNSSSQTPRPTRLMPDTPSTQPPPEATAPQEPTIGERLGRLDAEMKTAPADSLPILQAEYQRLLEGASGVDQVQTGEHPAADGSGPQPFAANPDVPPGQMLGFRASELKRATKTTASADAAPVEPRSYKSYPRRAGAASAGVSHTSTVRRNVGASAPETHMSTPRRTAGVAGTAATARPTESQPAASHVEAATGGARPAEATSNERDRHFVNGVAASRAGHYAEAASELPEVVASPPPGKKVVAQYSYAQSLEKTGDLSKAADQYLKASKGGEDLSDKSYISYCRVLAKSGDRTRARQLLTQFIDKHPRSTQVVTARQLLQTL